MMNIARPALAILLGCGVPGSGAAAASPSNTQPAPATDMSGQNGTLSDKLDATAGVIHPQGAVDPDMAKQPPATGTMPVIPPAGTTGNAPNVQPK